jgi:hypothetical protein
MAERVYLTGRSTASHYDIPELGDLLEVSGYEITWRWWEEGAPKKPYRSPESHKHNVGVVKEALGSAATADILIQLSQPGMRGVYVEQGAFLAAWERGDNPNPRMYIVGGADQEHVFESLPFVSFTTMDELQDTIKAGEL